MGTMISTLSVIVITSSCIHLLIVAARIEQHDIRNDENIRSDDVAGIGHEHRLSVQRGKQCLLLHGVSFELRSSTCKTEADSIIIMEGVGSDCRIDKG